ncbi:adenylyltransferase [Candidatus Woesearchaeota archaeon]|nr:adenylyltransferase [Candidatus Woesearchaeota archaeon]
MKPEKLNPIKSTINFSNRKINKRYSRQIILEEIGKKGQMILNNSCVSIVGLGALGSTCAELLARAGIGKLILFEKDVLEIHNLHRQILYDEREVGKRKAVEAKNILENINSDIDIVSYDKGLDKSNVNLLKESDIILGCTDNFESRFLINEFSLKEKIPWVHGGAVKTVGNLLNVIPEKVCFRCIFPVIENFSETADSLGIINSIPAVIGSLQATQAIKILLKKEYEKMLVYFNVWTNELTKVNVEKNPDCPACNGKYEFLG